MNIRSIRPKIYLPQEKSKTEAQKEIRKEVSISTDYKEKEGRNPEGEERGEHQKSRPLNDEEIEEALSKLKEFSGFKKNHLSIRIQKRGKKKIFCIENSSGELVRRISEDEISTLLESRDKIKGQIFDKAM